MEQLSGIVYRIDPVKRISDKFSVRNFVIQENKVTNYGEQTSYYQVQAVNDRMSLIDQIREGDQVKVKVYINGKKYVNKQGQEAFIVSLNLSSVEKEQVFNNRGVHISQDDPVEYPVSDGGSLRPQDDDLPF